MEATGVVPWEANARTWQFTHVGQQAVKLLGYPVDRWYETDFWADHLYADDRARSIQYCMEHSQIDDQYQFEYRMHSADGRIVWIHDIVTVIRENGLPVLLRGFLIDVTARKEADEALRAKPGAFSPCCQWVEYRHLGLGYSNESRLSVTNVETYARL